MNYHKNLLEYAEQKVPVVVEEGTISDGLFKKYGVNRGLRDLNGKGVLVGITEISEVNSKKLVDGKEVLYSSVHRGLYAGSRRGGVYYHAVAYIYPDMSAVVDYISGLSLVI